MTISDVEFQVVAHPTSGEENWDYYPTIQMRYQVDAGPTNDLVSKTIEVWRGVPVHAFRYQAINHGVEVLAKSLNLLLAAAEQSMRSYA